jgi:hypothetical protein
MLSPHHRAGYLAPAVAMGRMPIRCPPAEFTGTIYLYGDHTYVRRAESDSIYVHYRFKARSDRPWVGTRRVRKGKLEDGCVELEGKLVAEDEEEEREKTGSKFCWPSRSPACSSRRLHSTSV